MPDKCFLQSSIFRDIKELKQSLNGLVEEERGSFPIRFEGTIKQNYTKKNIFLYYLFATF